MRALHLEPGNPPRVVDDHPTPEPAEHESLVRVLRAGVCATDLALARGYMGFRGVPGHEFVGVAATGAYAGQRVVGEINAACTPGASPELGGCDRNCDATGRRHCPRRTVLGIAGRPGAFAECLALPEVNLLPVPDAVSTDAATFVEPLAAALEVLDQVQPSPGTPALVVGDGRLGLLCAQVLASAGLEVTVAGRHADRARAVFDAAGLTATFHEGLFEDDAPPPSMRYPLCVEATGRASVLPRALASTAPRGTLVLKTTTERPTTLDLSPLVVDEITMVGSRCGAFAPALEWLAKGRVAVEPMVVARYPLDDAPSALERAGRGGVLKVLVDVADA